MDIFDQLSKQIKVFCMTLIAMFLIVSMQHLGLKLRLFQNFQMPKIDLVSPLPKNNDKLFEVLPFLHNKKTDFSLNKDISIVPLTYADNDLLANEAKAYLVIDLDTGQILASKNSNQKLAVASLTKIMTAVVALDLGLPDEEFTILDKATRVIPTNIGLTSGESLTLNELLYGSLLMSGNDAAEALKNGFDEKYGEKIFIRAMNEKARFLNLTNTHFSNPQGFDYGNNYSSANDIAILSQYALSRYPLINSIVKKEYLYIPPSDKHKEFKMHNWNGLIGVYPDTQGVKIGYTSSAGKTTVVVSSREGKQIMVVLLGAPGILERDLWAAQLLDFGYSQAFNFEPVNITESQLQEKYNSWYNL
jgi:D-alanyl-D-alanine carboxypeptidase